MPECTCSIDLGYSLITEDVTVSEPYPSPQAKVVDLEIPTGKIVTGAGASLTTINGDPADESNPYWGSAVSAAGVLSGAHPSDSTKWRFVVSNQSGDSGANGSTTPTFRVWIAVISQ